MNPDQTYAAFAARHNTETFKRLGIISKHEWQLAEDGSPFIYLLSDQGVNRMSCQVQGGYDDNGNRTTEAERLAQARKFLAVEDLLDVAITLCNQFAQAGVDAVEDSNDPAEMLHFKARAAIAKTKGE